MNKKTFTPILIQEISKPIVSMGKHFDPMLEYAPTQKAQWYDTLDCALLVKQYGSPLFVASEQFMRFKIKQFKKIFQFPGFNTKIAYSFKTNYLPRICNVFLKEGCLAEVVSGMEYQLAKKLHVKGEHIIFNGPYKTAEELQNAIQDGVIIHIDNWDELQKIQMVAATLKQKAQIGIRFNFSYFNYLWDKFGFHYDENIITTLLETIKADPYLEFVSIHNHCGTYIMEPNVYATGIHCIARIMEIAHSLKLKPTVIDLGGGFPSVAKLKQQFSSGYANYDGDLILFADAMHEGLAKIRKQTNEDLTLIFEPGRALIDEAIILIATVVANKSSYNNSTITLLDAGVNILPTSYWYHREPKIIGNTLENYKKQRICGPLCMQIDVINEAAYLPEMKPAMQVIIPNVGAYNQTQSMQFIQCRPATVLIQENHKPICIRRKETFDDVFIRDDFPNN